MEELIGSSTERIRISDYSIYISKLNGQTLFIHESDKKTKKEIYKEMETYHFFDKTSVSSKYDKRYFKTIYISLHLSSACNMKCGYCFKQDKDNVMLSFEKSKQFIDFMIEEYPDAEKYIVDPTGSGEPLLKESVLYKIGEYCTQKSNHIKKEVLPMIVTNGILLDKHVVNSLRDSGILFGISLDGRKKDNDSNRRDYSGRSVYRKVLGNVKAINDRSLLGIAVTLTNKNLNLVRIIKHLVKYHQQ